jgi:hypothetical protein
MNCADLPAHKFPTARSLARSLPARTRTLARAGGKLFTNSSWAVTPVDTLSLNLSVTDKTGVNAELGAARRVDEWTTVEAVVKHDFSGPEEAGPSLLLRSQRMVSE